MRYQKLVADVMRGDYNAGWNADHPLKLRMHVRNLNDEFEKICVSKGHTKEFRAVNDVVDSGFESEDSDTGEVDIYDWIRDCYRESRGSELPGLVTPAVVENLFQQQTVSWVTISKDYLTAVIKCIHDFINAAVKDLVPDPQVSASLQSRLLREFDGATKMAKDRLDVALADERGAILQTVNHYFAENLRKAREERLLVRFSELGIQDGRSWEADIAALKAATHLSNEDQAAFDIHDILKAYYQVAIKRLQDQVIMGVAERCLLGSTGFVTSFNANVVGDMADEDLAAVAAENYATTTNRSELAEKLRRFEEALRIAKSV